MKTFAILAASIAYAGAAPLATDSETFKLIASAPGTPINARYLTVNNGFFYVGKETNSTCGNIAPIFEGGDAGWLAIFGDGKENQQQGRPAKKLQIPQYSTNDGISLRRHLWCG